MLTRFGKSYEPVKDEDGIDSLNLKDFFEVDYDDQPHLVDLNRCIYLITNLVSGRIYVGQTQNLWSRFREGGFCHLFRVKDGNNDLYRDMRSLGFDKFKVEVLESDILDLGSREIYWIEYFDAFEDNTKGYNENAGGTWCDHLNTPENKRKSLERSYETNLKRGNGDAAWMLHTPEVIELRVERDKENHGGRMAMHSKEACKRSSITRSLNKIFESIHTKISIIKDKGFPVRAEYYIHQCGDPNIWNHICCIINRALLLIDNEKCNPEIEFLIKDIYNYVLENYREWYLERFDLINFDKRCYEY